MLYFHIRNFSLFKITSSLHVQYKFWYFPSYESIFYNIFVLFIEGVSFSLFLFVKKDSTLNFQIHCDLFILNTYSLVTSYNKSCHRVRRLYEVTIICMIDCILQCIYSCTECWAVVPTWRFWTSRRQGCQTLDSRGKECAELGENVELASENGSSFSSLCCGKNFKSEFIGFLRPNLMIVRQETFRNIQKLIVLKTCSSIWNFVKDNLCVCSFLFNFV